LSAHQQLHKLSAHQQLHNLSAHHHQMMKNRLKKDKKRLNPQVPLELRAPVECEGEAEVKMSKSTQ
jgi:hypothetical protein